MRLRTPVAVVFSTAIVAMATAPVALAQVDWAYIETVVPPGEPGTWDSYVHRLGNIVFDGTTYHMFLLGGQTWLPWDSAWAVGHWTLNPLTQEWDEDDANPVLSPEPGHWDGFTIWDLAVLYEGGVFKMWYGAAAAFPGEGRVGYATSPDGSDWTKDLANNPLQSLAPGAPGEWDDLGVAPSAVLYDGVGYRMWFVARKDDPGWGTWRLGTATSPDGITWTRHPDPVLVGSLPWEGDLLYFPEVIPYGGGYVMWYTGFGSGPAAIGYAVSPDGIHWGRWPDNPVLSPLPGCNAADSIAVIIESNTVYGWVSNCYHVWFVSSPLDVAFFDHFETGDTAIWSSMVP